MSPFRCANSNFLCNLCTTFVHNPIAFKDQDNDEDTVTNEEEQMKGRGTGDKITKKDED